MLHCFLVRIRAIPIRSDARPWLEPVDLFLNDPRGMEMARWSARSAANGPIQVLVQFKCHLLEDPSVCLSVCLSTNSDLSESYLLYLIFGAKRLSTEY